MHCRCRKHWLPWADSGNGWRRWRRLLQIQRAGSQYIHSSGRYTLGRSPRCSATNRMAVLPKQQQINRLWCQGSIAVLPPEAHEHPVALAARQRLLGGLTAPSTARRGLRRLLQQSRLPQIWRRLSARGVLLFDVELHVISTGSIDTAITEARLGASRSATLSGRLEWFADKPAAQLNGDDVGKFVEMTSANIPEAFQHYYAEAAARGDTFVLKGGCKGLQVCAACHLVHGGLRQHRRMSCKHMPT